VLLASAATAALWGAVARTSTSAAAESPATISRPAAAAADFDLFRGKGGFTLRRPTNAGWVTAFVRCSPQRELRDKLTVRSNQRLTRILEPHQVCLPFIRTCESITDRQLSTMLTAGECKAPPVSKSHLSHLVVLTGQQLLSRTATARRVPAPWR